VIPWAIAIAGTFCFFAEGSILHAGILGVMAILTSLGFSFQKNDFDNLSAKQRREIEQLTARINKLEAQLASPGVSLNRAEITSAPKNISKPKTKPHKPEQPSPQKIVTRTTSNPQTNLIDDWAEKTLWSEDELSRLEICFNSGMPIMAIANSMRLDQKDIVYKLARVIFNVSGDLDDVSSAPNNGKSWSKEQSNRLVTHLKAGKSLEDMAMVLGRTQIAVAWRLVDQERDKLHWPY
jgi:hypothetical protein